MNYQKKLEQIISSLTAKPKLLLHSCCAPCSSYVIEYLNKYFDITVFYYNPNIDEYSEYEKRLNEQKKFIEQFCPTIKVIDGDYEVEIFKKLSSSLENEKEGGARCNKCYYMRMEKTALTALELKYDYFTTTLSISPYKNSLKLNEIGEYLMNKYNTKYLFADFKKNNGYKRSIELSKEYNLYRQTYCGCSFSKTNTISNKNKQE